MLSKLDAILDELDQNKGDDQGINGDVCRIEDAMGIMVGFIYFNHPAHREADHLQNEVKAK